MTEHRGPVLDTRRAAEYCGLKPQTLRKLKSEGKGPRVFKQGRLNVYYPADLDAWLSETITEEEPFTSQQLARRASELDLAAQAFVRAGEVVVRGTSGDQDVVMILDENGDPALVMDKRLALAVATRIRELAKDLAALGMAIQEMEAPAADALEHALDD